MNGRMPMYIGLNEVPTGTWHAIASEDLKDFSDNHHGAYMQFLMQITSDNVLKAESIDFESMEGTPACKSAAKSVKEWILCRPIKTIGNAGVGEGIDQNIAFAHAASAAKKPIRTMMFHFFQQQTPPPRSFILIEPR